MVDILDIRPGPLRMRLFRQFELHTTEPAIPPNPRSNEEPIRSANLQQPNSVRRHLCGCEHVAHLAADTFGAQGARLSHARRHPAGDIMPRIPQRPLRQTHHDESTPWRNSKPVMIAPWNLTARDFPAFPDWHIIHPLPQPKAPAWLRPIGLTPTTNDRSYAPKSTHPSEADTRADGSLSEPSRPPTPESNSIEPHRSKCA